MGYLSPDTISAVFLIFAYSSYFSEATPTWTGITSLGVTYHGILLLLSEIIQTRTGITFYNVISPGTPLLSF